MPRKTAKKADPIIEEELELDDDLELDEDEELEDEEPQPAPKKKAPAKKKAAKKPEPEPELDDEEDEDEDEPESDLPERETYTAKQVATRIGTDPKTLRKFFRSPASTVESVGQGGRYEFDAEDMPKIKQEFETWNATKPSRGRPSADGSKAEKKSRTEVADELPEEEELDLDEDLEPDDEELDDLDDEELDLDEDED